MAASFTFLCKAFFFIVQFHAGLSTMPSKLVAKRLAMAEAAAVRKKTRERRGRGLIIAGAVLIILTYTVKEIFREELKDFSESIAAAQIAEDAASTQQIISTRQIAMNMHLRQVQSALAAPQQAEVISKSNLQMELADLSQLYSDLASTVVRVDD